MKKIIELHQKKAGWEGNPLLHSWKIELETAIFPSILEKGICHACLFAGKKDSRTKKDLISAERLIEMDGKKRDADSEWNYRCTDCAKQIIYENLGAEEGEFAIEITNPQDLEEIRKELKKYE